MPPRRPGKSKGGRTQVEVDFTGVEAGGRRIPPGDYVLLVHKAEQTTAERSGKPTIKWEFKVADGPHKGTTLYYNTSLQPQALWNLKNLLMAMEFEVEGKLKLDLRATVGRQFGGTVDLEEYQGKTRSKVVDVFPLSEFSEEEDDGEIDEEIVDEEDEILDEEDEELEEEAEVEEEEEEGEEGEDEEEIIDEEDEEDEEEEEEEEPAPTPRRGRKSSRRK